MTPSTPHQPPPGPPHQGHLARRTIYKHGAVLTPEGTQPAPTALCVDGGTIAWMGPDIGLAPYADGADEVVDLAGRLVTPAFVDAHVHLSQTGLRLAGLDLSSATSRDDVLDAVSAHTRSHTDAVVLGFGWDETAWPDPRPPSGTELDRAAPGRAVYLSRVDVHSAVVSDALSRTVPRLTSAPGWDGTGRVERDAHHLVRDAVQGKVTRSQRKDAIAGALAAAARAGLGSVHEMAAPHLNPADDLTLLDDLAAEHPIVDVVRYWGEHVSTGGVEHALALGCVGAAGDVCVDGAFGSRTAGLCEPYADRDGHTGHLYLDAAEVADHVAACTRAGLQAGFHCIGDAATAVVADGFRLAEKLVGNDRLAAARHRLEHVELIAPEHTAALASYAVVVSGQPAFDAAWGGPDGMYADRLGPERALAANPWRAFLDAGIPLAFGSDSPITPFDPWGGVRAAARHHNPDARVTAAQAYAAHTAGGWYAAGRDTDGGLRPGAEATFAVWDVERADLPDVLTRAAPECVRTVVSGQTVYARGEDDVGALP
jgi:predicted amidohydrolase YtcJ